MSAPNSEERPLYECIDMEAYGVVPKDRLEAAERERDELKALCHDADQETMLYVARAEAAERERDELRGGYGLQYEALGRLLTALAEAREALEEIARQRVPGTASRAVQIASTALASRPGEQDG